MAINSWWLPAIRFLGLVLVFIYHIHPTNSSSLLGDQSAERARQVTQNSCGASKDVVSVARTKARVMSLVGGAGDPAAGVEVQEPHLPGERRVGLPLGAQRTTEGLFLTRVPRWQAGCGFFPNRNLGGLGGLGVWVGPLNQTLNQGLTHSENPCNGYLVHIH